MKSKSLIKLVSQAKKIALKDLRACYEERGIVAGRHHFTDYWGRDGFFAALGSLATGDQEIVENMVRLFFEHQRKDGLLPYRLLRGPVTIGKYFGKPKFYDQPRPTYRLRGLGPEVLDGATLGLLLLAELGLIGWKNAEEYSSQAALAFEFLTSKEKHGLLWDGVMAEWNDTAWKWGNLLYSNVIYWRALSQWSAYLKKTKQPGWKKFEKKQQQVAQTLRDRLWNGEFFADWHDYQRQDYFYPFGNCLAVAWGLTNQSETESILANCEPVKIRFTLETNYPKYPWWRIDLFNHLVGMGDYQNQSTLWWFPGTAYLEALVAVGRRQQADKQVKIMAEEVIAHGIYECYERNGQPLKRSIYRSEKPFAWSAGLILHALESWEKSIK